MVVIGEADKKSGDIIEKIYKNICSNSPPVHRMDRLSAEITKVGFNCFLTTKISYANMLGEIAIKSGIDPDPILRAIGEDSRIGSKFFKYGFGYGGPCVKKGTKILGEHGFIDINNSINVIAKNGCSQGVNKHFSTPYEGEMIKIKIKGGYEVSLTPDHLVWIDNSGYKEFGNVHLKKNNFIGWKCSQDLKKGDLVSIPRPCFEEDLKVDDSYLQLCGWYVSEGNVEKYRINIRQKKNDTIKEIASLSKRSSIIKDKSGYKVRIYGKEIANTMSMDFGDGSSFKKIPIWIYSLPLDKKYIFLKSYLRGDGNWFDRVSSFTSSEHLKNDLIFLYLSIGYFPFICYQTQNKKYNGYEWQSKGWRVSLSKTDSIELLDILNIKFNFSRGNRRQYLKRDNEFLVPIIKCSKENYKGDVLNIDTYDETYSVPFRVHNCFPRDTRALNYYANNLGIEPWIIRSVMETNSNHLEFQLKEFFKANKNKAKSVIFESITYKIGTTIIEESQQLLFAVKIAKQGYKVVIREHPEVIRQVKEEYGDLFIYQER